MERERVVYVDKSFFDVRPRVLEFFLREGYRLSYEGSTSLVFRQGSGIVNIGRPGHECEPDEVQVELRPHDADTEIQLTYRFRDGDGPIGGAAEESGVWDEDAADLIRYLARGFRSRTSTIAAPRPARRFGFAIVIGVVMAAPVALAVRIEEGPGRTLAFVLVMVLLVSFLARYWFLNR